MRRKSHATDLSSEEVVKDIRRATRKQYSSEEKIRIVLDGLRGEHSIAELCRREGIAESLYYSWPKEFTSKPASGAWPVTPPAQRPAARSRNLRRQAQELKEVVVIRPRIWSSRSSRRTNSS